MTVRFFRPRSYRAVITAAFLACGASPVGAGPRPPLDPQDAECSPAWLPTFGGVAGTAGLDGPVRALASGVDDFGPALFAGGEFTSIGGLDTRGVARWNGSTWSALGSGCDGPVLALEIFDDGGGPALYVGGSFFSAGGVPAWGVARWDGTAWSSLGTSIGHVHALTSFDDGGGTALYAGCTAPQVSVQKWNGASWTQIGGAFFVGTSPEVNALAAYDGGSGSQLYAGGHFKEVGGTSAFNLARWSGTTWEPVAGGLPIGTYIGSPPPVATLAVHDPGAGPALFVGGRFYAAGGVPAASLASWNGSTWSPVGGGVGAGTPSEIATVSALAVFDDGGGPALHAGGDFLTASESGDSYLARWGCAAITGVPGCSGNPARLGALAPSAPLGTALPLEIAGHDASSGFAVLFAGAPGVDGGGCGLFLPGLGELLLAPAPPPILVGTAGLSAGTSLFVVPVPATPALSGAHVFLHGVAVDPALPAPLELTNALSVTLGL